MRGLIAMMMLAVSVAQAQNVSDIRRNPDYICAEGTAADMRVADSIAVDAMAVKLARHVRFPFSDKEAEAVMRSYRDDIRRECGSSSLSGRDGVSSLRYIRKDQVERVFARRRSKVEEMRGIAAGAEESLAMDVALRYWTWVSVLLKSLPPVDVVGIAYADSRKRAVLEGLNVALSQSSLYGKDLVELSFTWRGQPVKSVDYRVFDGLQWSPLMSAKDGKGFAEMRPGSDISQYRIRYEVDPSRLYHIYSAVREVEDALDMDDGAALAYDGSPRGGGSQGGKHQSAGATATGTAASAAVSSRYSPAPDTLSQAIDMSEVKRKILDVVSRDKFQSGQDRELPALAPALSTAGYNETVRQLCSAIEAGDYESVRGLFTEEGYSMFNALVRYGHARTLTLDRLSYYRLGDEVWCRSIPMTFSFDGNPRQFVEDLTLTFDAAGLVCSLSFSLSSEAVRAIFSHDEWSEEARVIIVSFLENYKTAYALKRIDYISSIFDDDALIITGHVLKTAHRDGEFADNHYVQLTRQDKRRYITRLKRVFASQEFINIQFTDCKVVKLGKGEQLFGIQLRQEYWSSSYSDAGYLFVLVDLSDYAAPLIHVRTWQEEPDAEYGVVGPYNF